LLLDLSSINMLTYKILIQVNDRSESVSNRMLSFAHNNQNITWFAKTIGGHDYELRAVIESVEQFQKLLKDIRSEFSSIIESVEPILIFKELKEDYATMFN